MAVDMPLISIELFYQEKTMSYLKTEIFFFTTLDAFNNNKKKENCKKISY